MSWLEKEIRPNGKNRIRVRHYSPVTSAKARKRYQKKVGFVRAYVKRGTHSSAERERIVDQELTKVVFDSYGARCNCCGETMRQFLQIDHVNNDGNLERRGNKSKKRLHLLRKIIRLNFPPTYQILCANCNWGKERNGGVCPHVALLADPMAHRKGVQKNLSLLPLPLFENLKGNY